MINATSLLSAIVLVMVSGYSAADDLTDAAEGLCDTIKTCALEAVAGQDLTDELQASMAPMLDNNCAKMSSQVKAVPPGHKLYQPAVGCMRSMASLSCAQLHNAGVIKTPECTQYEQLLNAANAAKQ